MPLVRTVLRYIKRDAVYFLQATERLMLQTCIDFVSSVAVLFAGPGAFPSGRVHAAEVSRGVEPRCGSRISSQLSRFFNRRFIFRRHAAVYRKVFVLVGARRIRADNLCVSGVSPVAGVHATTGCSSWA